MTVTAQQGAFSFGAQTAKGAVATTFYRHKAAEINFGVVQDIRQLPLEIGGVSVPTGAFKAGVMVAGGATILPRMEEVMGWLFQGAMGAASAQATYGGEAGVVGHVFSFNSSDDTLMPWMSVRKYIPAAAGGEALEVRGVDCKVMGLEFTIPAAGQVMMRPQFVGITPSFAEDPSLASYGAYEDSDSIPLTCSGSFKVNSTTVKALGATVRLTNMLSTQFERVIGSYYLDDLIAITRRMEIRFVHKWDTPDLFQQIFGGATDSTTWSPAVFYAPIDIELNSPANISGKNQPYKLQIKATNVSWQPDGPAVLTAGGILQQPYVGIVQEPSSGDYAQIIMVNEKANYTWPT